MSSGSSGSIADLLLAARRQGVPIAIPDGSAEPSIAEAYAIQDAVVAQCGGIGGWKVGAASPAAEPLCAPLPASLIFHSPAQLPAEAYGRLGIEAEIAFRITANLPLRDLPYNRSEVIACVGAVCAAIEVVDSRWQAWPRIGAGWQLADHSANGALIHGSGIFAWHDLDLSIQPVRLLIDDRPAIEAIGGNTAGDPVRLLVWVANHAARRGHPLKAGDVVTTGSCTGMSFAEPGSRVRAELHGIGEVELLLER